MADWSKKYSRSELEFIETSNFKNLVWFHRKELRDLIKFGSTGLSCSRNRVLRDIGIIARAGNRLGTRYHITPGALEALEALGS